MLTIDFVGVNSVLTGVAGFDEENISKRDLSKNLRSFAHNRLDHMIKADLRVGEEIISQMIWEFDWRFRFIIFCTKQIADQIDGIVNGFFG